MPYQEPDYGLDFLRAQFRDPEAERGYRFSTWPEWLRQLKWVTYVTSLFYLSGGLVDYLLAGPTDLFMYLICTRVVFVFSMVGLLSLAPRMRRPEHLDWLITLALLLATIATCFILALTPGLMVQQPLTMIVVVLTYYLFVPNRPLLILASGFLASVAFFAVSMIFIPQTADQKVLIFIYLAMANSLGGFSVWRLNLLSRRQYASLRAQRDAVARLRLEVAERQKAEREARDSQERFRRLIELSPDAVVVHKNGLLLYANRAALTMTGISPQTDIHSHNLLEFVCQDSQEEMSKHLDQWRQGNVENKTDDVTLVRDDGREVACEIISGLTTYDGQAAVQTVIRDISHRKHMEADLRRMATTDHLTQLHNRRNYLELSRGEVERARRYARPLSVMVLDLDNFKNVNDCHGHAAGDEVLRRTAQVCRDQLRECDFMGRLGGEEFGVTLPETELEMAQKVADRLRMAVSEIRLELESGLVSLTVSIGVAQCDLENESLDDVLLRADRAMYTAKEAGRNQVCYARGL